MTEQMAVDIVRKEKAYMDAHAGTSQSEAFKMAIEALEKQIPKKPYYRVEEDAQGYACPVCDIGVTIDKGRIRCGYCTRCGQAIDWSDEE